MAVAEQTFTFPDNAPWTKKYELVRHSAPLDLRGATLRMQFRPTAASDEVAIDLSTTNGRLVIVDGQNGIWAFNVSQIDALQVAAGTYVHDMLVTLADGEIYNAFQGEAEILQGVTRSLLWPSAR